MACVLRDGALVANSLSDSIHLSRGGSDRERRPRSQNQDQYLVVDSGSGTDPDSLRRPVFGLRGLPAISYSQAVGPRFRAGGVGGGSSRCLRIGFGLERLVLVAQFRRFEGGCS